MADYFFLAFENQNLVDALQHVQVPALPSGGALPHRRDRILHATLSDQGVFFDGIAVIGESLIRTSGEAASATGSARGNYLLARHAEAGAVSIEIDPFGYYPLFTYRRDGIFCAGNRIARIVDELAKLGRVLRRDMTVHGWFTVQGSGAFDLSAYQDIALLPPGTTIHLDDRNRVTFCTKPMADLFYSTRPIEELIDDAAHEILGSIRALTGGAFSHRICDLTGGMDSRLVLSAIIHAKAEDAFLFYTKGRYPNPDANVAALIRKQFCLRKASHVFPPKPVQLTPFERLRTSTGHVDGLLSTFFEAGPASTTPDRTLSIGGGSGELLREFWASGHPAAAKRIRRWFDVLRPGTAAPVPLSPLYDKARKLKSRSTFLQPALSDVMVEQVSAFAHQSLAAGIRPEHIGDLFYLSSRAKYHFGVWWASSSRARFHPLYSPAALKAAHAIPNADKAANRLGFELMRRFCPQLAAVPFADKRWAPTIMPEAPPPVTQSSPFYGSAAEKGLRVFATPPRKNDRERTAWESELIAARAKQRVVDLGIMLHEFHAAQIRYDPLEAVFDVDAVRRFLAQPHSAFTGKYDTDNAYRLIGALVWANQLEIRASAR